MGSPNLAIDRAGAADFPVIRALAETTWQHHYPSILSEAQIEYMLERGYSPVALTAFIAEEGAGMLLAKLDGEPVAFAAYYATDDMVEMKLDKLYVLPDHQRHGIGRALVDRVAQIAVDAGFRTLIVNVNKHNAQAIAAYEKNGFAIRESTVNDIGHGFVMDDYVMAKPLDAFPGEPPDAAAGRV